MKIEVVFKADILKKKFFESHDDYWKNVASFVMIRRTTFV